LHGELLLINVVNAVALTARKIPLPFGYQSNNELGQRRSLYDNVPILRTKTAITYEGL